MSTPTTDGRIAEWTPPADEPVFAGHFPGNPLLPGALLIDWAMERFNRHAGRAASHGEIRQAKFPSPARPGVRLTLACESAPNGRTRLTVTGHEPATDSRTVLELVLDAARPAGPGSA